jgi:hypothetical protein
MPFGVNNQYEKGIAISIVEISAGRILFALFK